MRRSQGCIWRLKVRAECQTASSISFQSDTKKLLDQEFNWNLFLQAAESHLSHRGLLKPEETYTHTHTKWRHMHLQCVHRWHLCMNSSVRDTPEHTLKGEIKWSLSVLRSGTGLNFSVYSFWVIFTSGVLHFNSLCVWSLVFFVIFISLHTRS